MSTKEDKIKLIEDHIKSYPDFPKKGVLFRDIFAALLEPKIFAVLNDVLLEEAKTVGPVDYIVGLDARGFIFGPLIALHMKLPFVPIRKKGKLPGETVSTQYALEYGEASIEIQKGVIKPGSRVLIVDDLLATGGTLGAACKLLKEIGANDLYCLVVMELSGLNGRSKIPVDVISLITY